MSRTDHHFMNQVLYNYDIYPKVFLGNRKQSITIQPLGLHAAFEAGHEYTLRIYKVNQSNPRTYPERSGRSEHLITPDVNGYLRFEAFFEGEGEHFINIYEDPDAKPWLTLSVYSLNEDMRGRYPLRGDLHIHTWRSDGKEAPEVVAANYRGHGYDFCTISDHHRYYPSLDAIAAYGDLTDLVIVPGEEVHLPLSNAHYINFGGLFSINALVTPSKNAEYDDDIMRRSFDGNAPDTMTVDEFKAMIEKRADSVPRENRSEQLSFAAISWIYEQIQASGGLGIFPHPYWLCQMMQLPEDYIEFIYEQAPFDAFEVLGGESIYSRNGFQTGFYYEMKTKGIDRPVVGSTDSHGSTEHNKKVLVASTIVFSPENNRKSLIESIKSKYSIAVDTISDEYRLVGDFRLIKYGSFLMENYFPLHDLACRAEGYYMKQYLNGDCRAERILREMKGQIPEMLSKYFIVYP